MNLKAHNKIPGLSTKAALAVALCAGLMVAAPQFASAQPLGPDAAAEAGAGTGRPPHEGGRHHHGRGGPDGGRFLHELKALDLSDAQRGSIGNAIKAQWQSAHNEHEALRKLQRGVDIATPDSAAYGSLVNQLADAQANAARDRVQKQAALKAEVFAMLTPVQKAALAEKLKKLPEPPARSEKTGWRKH